MQLLKEAQQYELPENDLRKICVLIGVPQHTKQHEIPQEIVLQYYMDRRRADQIGLHFDDRDIWNIVCRAALARRIELPKKDEPNIRDLFASKKIKHGTKVLCTWRRKTVPGVIVGTAGSDCVVVLDGEGEERRLSPDKVTLAPEDGKEETK